MLSQSERQQLRTACLRGDSAGAMKALRCRSSSGGCCNAVQAHESFSQAACAGLLEPLDGADGNTALHNIAAGEPLGLGCLLVWWRSRPHSCPSRHQSRRADLLARLLLQQPRLALLAGCRNAAGQTPLHAAVCSESWLVLSLLLAALQQLLDQGGGQQAPHSAAAADASASAATAAMQLLLSVQDAQGLTPLELALQHRHWPSVRLLAAAAGGGLPLSLSQIEACSLVQRALGSGGGFATGSTDTGTGPSPDVVHISESGGTVTEALGGLLSKLWDAFGSSSAAAAESRDEAVQAEQRQRKEQQQQQQQQAGGRRLEAGTPLPPVPLELRLQPLSQAEVLVLVGEAERQALAAAASAAAAAAAVASPTAASIGVASTDVGSAGTKEAGSGASPVAALHRCIVCYEDFPPGWLSVRLPCRHTTCDACWGGVLRAAVDEGDPGRAVCPQPGCGTPLPSATAARLLPEQAAGQLGQLLAQRYLATHPGSMRCCPHAACGDMLHLPFDKRRLLPGASTDGRAAAAATPAPASVPAPAAVLETEMEQALPAAHGEDAEACASTAATTAAEASAAAAAAAVASTTDGSGLNAVCGGCSHRFCWQCGEEAHEPASCSQMRRWEAELAVLRQAAPSADRQWLSANTKRCPKCRAHIQKDGGCLHMSCRGCGLHFCWQCGREWSEHSAQTGGFYFCSLNAQQQIGTDELPEYSMADGGNNGNGSSYSLGGPLSWVAGVWSSVKAAAHQHQLQRYLRQYLRHSRNDTTLLSAATHMRLLLSAAGMLGKAGNKCGGAGGSPGGGRQEQGTVVTVDVGLKALGISAAEACRMSKAEWGDLCAAAAASAADAAIAGEPSLLPASLAAARAAAEAALTAALSGPASTSGSAAGDPAGYLLQLAGAVATARGLLQYSAVTLYLMPAGPPRRHLQQLSGSMQLLVGQLEPLLLALPEREAAQALQGASAAAASGGTGTQQQLTTSGSCGSAANASSSSSGGSGLTGWLLSRFFGVEPLPVAAALVPEAHPALASRALSGDVLLQQLHFAGAVHQQRGVVQARLRALEADMRQMVVAARRGLYD